MPSQSESCPSPSQSLCSTGQRGVSAASPIVWGESLATADMATAPVATEPNNQDLQNTSLHPSSRGLLTLQIQEPDQAKMNNRLCFRHCLYKIRISGLHASPLSIFLQHQWFSNLSGKSLENILIIWGRHSLFGSQLRNQKRQISHQL